MQKCTGTSAGVQSRVCSQKVCCGWLRVEALSLLLSMKRRSTDCMQRLGMPLLAVSIKYFGVLCGHSKQRHAKSLHAGSWMLLLQHWQQQGSVGLLD